MSQKKEDHIPAGCLTIFGLPFLAAGLFMLWTGVMEWKLYHDSAQWTRVPVTILDLDLEKSRGQKNTTYRVICSYRFELNGRAYTNERVGVERGSSSDYSMHKARHQQLLDHKQACKTWMAWVNPQNPGDSLLFRATSTEMYFLVPFGLVFGTVGFGLCFGGIYATVERKKRQSLLGRHPDRPWLAEQKWSQFVITGSPLRNVLISWGVGLFFGLLLCPIVIAMKNDPAVPDFALAVVGFFCLLVVSALVGAVYSTLQYLKYGTPRLILSQLPIRIGCVTNVTIMVSRAVDPEDGVNCTLTCEKKTSHGGSQSRTHVEFSKTTLIGKNSGRFTSRSTTIPVSLEIPENLPPREQEGTETVRWKLEVRAATPGVDLGVTFEDLPVYRVNDPSLLEKNPDYSRL